MSTAKQEWAELCRALQQSLGTSELTWKEGESQQKNYTRKTAKQRMMILASTIGIGLKTERREKCSSLVLTIQ